MPVSAALVAQLPKVVLHDHLDGGLRPVTVLELAAEVGYEGLPSRDPGELADHLHRGATRRDLGAYLEMFQHTVGVLQTEDALARAARECLEDLAADGVVYAEVRFAPELHRQRGLSLRAVLDAVLDGVEDATRAHDLDAGIILSTMRSQRHSDEVVDLALAVDDPRVVAFDLAGQEAGHPASDHGGAIRRALDGGLHVTVHAGEAAGLASIRDALDSGAERLGHGVRLVDDFTDGEPGPLARRIIRDGIVLEICPSSNVHTGAATALATHPIERLRAAGVAVTVNTDNRLMSAVTVTDELAACAEQFGWTVHDLRSLTQTAVDAAFTDEVTRERVRSRVAAGYEDLAGE